MDNLLLSELELKCLKAYRLNDNKLYVEFIKELADAELMFRYKKLCYG